MSRICRADQVGLVVVVEELKLSGQRDQSAQSHRTVNVHDECTFRELHIVWSDGTGAGAVGAVRLRGSEWWEKGYVPEARVPTALSPQYSGILTRLAPISA